jgi:hypothetical protein
LNGVEQGLIASRFTVCIESTSFTIWIVFVCDSDRTFTLFWK